jgi:membrane associated rhomboid family serine protease
MLDDGDRRRRAKARLEQGWSVSLGLIVINVAVFVAQDLLSRGDPDSIYRSFALSVAGLKQGHLWQLLTFQFLHLPLAEGGIFHLLGNLFIIHVFGPPVERAIGHARLLALYLLGGTCGGLLQMAGGLLAPDHFGVAMVGASAGGFALIAAFAVLFPHRRLHLFFLPVAVRADVLFSLSVGVTLAGLFWPSGHVAHCAHLGGIMAGFIFMRRLVGKLRIVEADGIAKTSLNDILVHD